ncbi:MAG: uridylate kinase, partial [Roseivirga sp.]
ADPEKDPNAVRFEKLSFEEVIRNGYNIMDMTAFTLCQENNVPIIVFDMNKIGNLEKLVDGDEQIGTLIS